MRLWRHRRFCKAEEHLRATFGVDEIHLLTGTRNCAAQAAYKKAGFAIKDEVYMVKSI